MNKKILFIGGHFTPAYAVLTELIKRGYSNIEWVGHKYNQAGNKEFSPEYNSITDLGIKFHELKTGKLVRYWGLENIPYALWKLIEIPIGFFRAGLIVFKVRPKVVVSFGGYLAVPVAIWAKLLGAKVITHEQTIVAGLANKIIAKFSDIICVSWETSKDYFNKEKTVLTGNPIRKEIFQINKGEFLKDLDTKKPTIYVTGGNQGANFLNRTIFQIIPELLNDFNVIHQTGNSSVTKDFEYANELRNDMSENKKKSYLIEDFIRTSEIGDVLNMSELVISRSGANTVSEILALRKKAVLIPLPKSSNSEALKNAQYYQKTGLGKYILQKDLTPEILLKEIKSLVNQKVPAELNIDLPLDADVKIADIVENLIK